MKCWEYFTCEEPNCPAYGREAGKCWLVPGTRCHGKGQSILTEKIERCLACAVFNNSTDDDSLRQTIVFFHTQIKGLKTEPDRLAHNLTTEFSEICDMLVKLRKGDPSTRIAANSETGLFDTMKTLLNQLADNMQAMIDQTHEMAIGLCEHYDTLNRISSGDFSARAPENSPNELIAKLGMLINRGTETLTGAISRLEIAEEEARNAHQQLLAIVEFLPDATFVVDRDKKVIAWNRAIEEMTGVKKEEILGKGDYAYAVPFYGKRRPILIDLLFEDQAAQEKYRYVKREGRTLFAETWDSSPILNQPGRHYWGTATPLLDRDGTMIGGIETIRDITERKRAEEEKSRLDAQLHHSRMMEIFLTQLGHDLKTPLTPLFVMLPLIREQLPDGELAKMVEICSKNVNHIKALTDKALTLASLSATVSPAEMESIRLNDAVKKYLRDSTTTHAEKNLSCETAIAPDISVRAVPGQLKELFANLISNAARYSPENGVIRISAGQDGEFVTVSVRDDGIGLSPGHEERIFDEFFKADESRHDLNTKGLGLSICKRIVLNHNGKIWAESPGRGEGTAIRFTLPRADIKV